MSFLLLWLMTAAPACPAPTVERLVALESPPEDFAGEPMPTKDDLLTVAGKKSKLVRTPGTPESCGLGPAASRFKAPPLTSVLKDAALSQWRSGDACAFAFFDQKADTTWWFEVKLCDKPNEALGEKTTALAQHVGASWYLLLPLPSHEVVQLTGDTATRIGVYGVYAVTGLNSKGFVYEHRDLRARTWPWARVPAGTVSNASAAEQPASR
jgi:hypothetical protein